MVDDDLNLNPDIPPSEITSGIAWYREEDYQRIRGVLKDPDMPVAYADWLKEAEDWERTLQAEGKIRRARCDRRPR